MKNKRTTNYTKGDEPLGFISGVFIFIAMVFVAILFADVATGFNLHNLLASFF